MIFSTLNQLNCMLIFLVLGFACAIIFDIFIIIFQIKKSQKKLKIIKKIIFESIFFAIFAIFFDIFLNFFNFGKFSITLFLSFVAGFLWFKNTSKKSVEFLQNKCYTIFKFKTRKSVTQNESKLKS